MAGPRGTNFVLAGTNFVLAGTNFVLAGTGLALVGAMAGQPRARHHWAGGLRAQVPPL